MEAIYLTLDESRTVIGIHPILQEYLGQGVSIGANLTALADSQPKIRSVLTYLDSLKDHHQKPQLFPISLDAHPHAASGRLVLGLKGVAGKLLSQNVVFLMGDYPAELRRLEEASIHHPAEGSWDDPRRLRKLNQEILTSLSNAIETRDIYTNGHSQRVAWYSAEIARAMGWDDYEVERISTAGFLHDIGKVGIPDAVLLKPTGLTKYEFEIMKLHPELSASIVSKIESFQELAPWVRYHHEFYNGKGYPFGLKGQEIPIGARIIAVADAYDAMTSSRPYRTALSRDDAREIFEQDAGEQWDPEIARIAFECCDILFREHEMQYNIPEKLDEFRKMIFHMSLISGLYLYEYLYNEAEHYIENNHPFSLGLISIKGSIQHFSGRDKRALMDTLIEMSKNELHYPVQLSRYDYSQLVLLAPEMNQSVLRDALAKLKVKFFEKTDIFLTTRLLSYPESASNLHDLVEKLTI